MEEQEAIARLKRGDISGLEALVRKYQVQAVRAAYLITHDRGLAEDIVQAAFLRAYERIGQFDAGRPFGRIQEGGRQLDPRLRPQQHRLPISDEAARYLIAGLPKSRIGRRDAASARASRAASGSPFIAVSPERFAAGSTSQLQAE